MLHNAWLLIPPFHRRKGVFITLLIAAGSLLDLFSLAGFIPIIILLTDPVRLSQHELLSRMYRWSGFETVSQFAIALTLSFILFILIKTAVSKWIARRKASFAYGVADDLASNAVAAYLQMPYEKFTATDYSREMNRISNLPLTFANNILIPAGTILAEILVSSLLLIAIATYEIRGFLFLVLLLSPLLLLYKRKREIVRQTSEAIKTTYPRVLKHTLQAVEGLSEIRAFGKENFFRQRFQATFTRLTRIFINDHVTNTGTARTTEFLAAVSVGGLVIYVLLTEKTPADALLLLSLYAGLSFRMIPSVNRIMTSVTQMRTHEYTMEELKQMIRPLVPSQKSEITMPDFSEAIELKNITFAYDGKTPVLSDASLTIHKGEKIILLGPSGSGKTTLFLLLMHFVKPQQGTLTLDGQLFPDPASFRQLIGYVPQNPYVLDDTLIANIAFGVPEKEINLAKIHQLLRDLQLDTWANGLPNGLDTVLGERGAKLSGGQRQRVAIARALYHDARILLLDEMTNQLDRQTEREVIRAIDHLSSDNLTVVLITHHPESWSSFDCIYRLENGTFEKIPAEYLHASPEK